MVTEIRSLSACGKVVLTGKRQKGTVWDDENTLDMIWVLLAKVYTQVKIQNKVYILQAPVGLPWWLRW